LEIAKGELSVKEIFHTISGVLGGGLVSEGRGKLGIEVGRGIFNHSKTPQAVWGFIWAHQFLPPLILPLFLGLQVSLPGIVGSA